jgi:hypothetical protein
MDGSSPNGVMHLSYHYYGNAKTYTAAWIKEDKKSSGWTNRHPSLLSAWQLLIPPCLPPLRSLAAPALLAACSGLAYYSLQSRTWLPASALPPAYPGFASCLPWALPVMSLGSCARTGLDHALALAHAHPLVHVSFSPASAPAALVGPCNLPQPHALLLASVLPFCG